MALTFPSEASTVAIMESLAKIAKYTESDEDTPNEESVVEVT